MAFVESPLWAESCYWEGSNLRWFHELFSVRGTLISKNIQVIHPSD